MSANWAQTIGLLCSAIGQNADRPDKLKGYLEKLRDTFREEWGDHLRVYLIERAGCYELAIYRDTPLKTPNDRYFPVQVLHTAGYLEMVHPDGSATVTKDRWDCDRVIPYKLAVSTELATRERGLK